MASGLSVEVQLRTLIMAGMAPLLGWLADQVSIGAAILLVSAGVLALFPILAVRDHRES